MLVLSRKTSESIRIADNIEVVVLEVKHGKVRLGFRCPNDVSILRRKSMIAKPPMSRCR